MAAVSDGQSSRIIHTNDTLKFANLHSIVYLGCHVLGRDLGGIAEIDCLGAAMLA